MPPVLALVTVGTMAAADFGLTEISRGYGFDEGFFLLCCFLGLMNGVALSLRGRADMGVHVGLVLWISYLAVVPMVLRFGVNWVEFFVWAPLFMGLLVGGQGAGHVLGDQLGRLLRGDLD